jgi:hypothetical protein
MLNFVFEAAQLYSSNENDITGWEALLGIVIWAIGFVVSLI